MPFEYINSDSWQQFPKAYITECSHIKRERVNSEETYNATLLKSNKETTDNKTDNTVHEEHSSVSSSVTWIRRTNCSNPVGAIDCLELFDYRFSSLPSSDYLHTQYLKVGHDILLHCLHAAEIMLLPTTMARAVTVLTCTRELPGSNFGQGQQCRGCGLSCRYTNSGVAP